MLEEDLTARERLIVSRHRRRERAEKAAERWAVPAETYLRWEEGRAPCPEVKLRGLTQGEQFLILRLRAGLSRGELGRAVGLREQDVTRTEEDASINKKIVEYFSR